jgi:hypothetical protein
MRRGVDDTIRRARTLVTKLRTIRLSYDRAITVCVTRRTGNIARSRFLWQK